MKVLLANPPYKEEIDEEHERVFIRAGSRWPFSVIKKKDEGLTDLPFPFYLGYTAALLKNEGVEVSVIDGIALDISLDSFLDKTMSESPDIILFETSTPTIKNDLALIKALKDITSAKIVLSGAHVTVFPEATLRGSKYLDFIMLREYEYNFLELVKKLRDNESINDLEGIAFKENKKVIINQSTHLIDPLDSLPIPARHMFPAKDNSDIFLDKYGESFCQFRPNIQMHSSRGCPYKCDFCLWNQVIYNLGKYRTFSPKRVVDEMEQVVREYGAKEIYFDDDTFTVKKDHVLGICREIKDRLQVRWSCMGNVTPMNEEMVEAMANAGCVGLKFGVESGDIKISKKIGKPVDFEKIDQVIRWCAERGIKTHATFTFGLLGETRKSMENTLKFAQKLDVDSVQFSITTPFPGTRFYDEVKLKGFLTSLEWDKFDGSRSAVVRYPELSTQEIRDFCSKSYKNWLKRKVRDPGWLYRRVKYMGRRGNRLTILAKEFKKAIKLIAR
jgi:radical SAM superfamily enzyme YgiQ (UPF0313 family)